MPAILAGLIAGVADAFAAVGAAAGAGAAALGAAGGISGATAIAGVGALAGLAGAGVGIYGAIQQGAIARDEKQAEQIRNEQMNLDAMRKKRDTLRQAQIASSQATATAYSQGGGSSSGLQGAIDQISGQSGVNFTGINQNQQLGNQLSSVYGRKANDMWSNSTLMGFGTGLSSLGGGMVRNAGTIASVGSFLGSKF